VIQFSLSNNISIYTPQRACACIAARMILQSSKGQSSFFALNCIGNRFDCIHPLTARAMRLYQAIILTHMLYSVPLSNISKTEIEMLERVHRKILHSTQGFQQKAECYGMAVATGTKDSVLKRSSSSSNLLFNSRLYIATHKLVLRHVLAQIMDVYNAATTGQAQSS